MKRLSIKISARAEKEGSRSPMNEQGYPQNSSLLSREKTGTKSVTPSPPERGGDREQSTRFTRLVGQTNVAKTPASPMLLEANPVPGLSENARFQPSGVCPYCAGGLKKTSRVILSIPSAIVLVLFGVALMVFYGYATNFSQFPWYVRFALPAAYYIGSIFIGVGVIFFFIRERIWRCRECGQFWRR